MALADWEIWGLAWDPLPRAHRYFEMHQNWRNFLGNDDDAARHKAWMAGLGVPVYMLQREDDIPTSVALPLSTGPGLAPPPPGPKPLAANNPGATGTAVPPDRMGGDPAYPDPVRPAPVMVQPAINPPGPHAIDPGTLAAIIYHETASQRQLAGGPSLDAARQAMANAIVTGYDQGLGKNPNYTATPEYPAGDMGQILGGILNGRGSPAGTAFYSSLKAALDASNRSAPPGSGPYFNGRPDDRTTPRIEGGRSEPFVGTLGPYYGGLPWWAFFGNPVPK